MSAEPKSTGAETKWTGADPQVLADLDAVMRRVVDGTAIDPETSRRIEERADRITDQLRRQYGQIDVDQLLHDARDES
jgi:hypothetical protein